MRAAGNVPPPRTLFGNMKDRAFDAIGLDEYAGHLSRLNDMFLQRGMDVFDGLEDPYREVEFMVNVDGRSVPQKYSTAQLLKLSKPAWDEAKAVINSTIEGLIAGGIVTRTRQAVWSNRIDQRITNPEQFLTIFPWVTAPYTPHPEQVLPYLPRPKRVNYLALTPVAYDGARFPREALVEAATALAGAITSLHSAANANIGLSPAVFIACSPAQGAKENALTQRFSLKCNRLFQPTQPSAVHKGLLIDTSTDSFYESFNRKTLVCVPEDGGFDRREFGRLRLSPAHVTYGATSDALTEFAQLLCLAQFMVDIQSHVLLHSCVMFHQAMLQRTFEILRVPFGTTVPQYVAGIQAENNMREQIAVSNANSVLQTGFSLTAILSGLNNPSTSQARGNLSGSTVGTLPLAIANTIKNPTVGIPCALVSGVAALAAYLASDRSVTADRSITTIVDDATCYMQVEDGYSTVYPQWMNMFPTNWYSPTFHVNDAGITCKGVIESMPCLEIPNGR